MRSALFLLSVFFMPSISLAADFADTLKQELDRMEQSLKNAGQQSSWEEGEAVIQIQNVVFPSGEGDNSIDVQIEVEDNVASVHVSVIVDGKQVVLKDVRGDAWYGPYVRFIAENGVVSGYAGVHGEPLGLFGPSDPVTVEQLAKIAVRSSGITEAQCGGEVRNPSAKDRWSASFVSCAESNGWALYSDSAVDVSRPATRAEVVITILQAFGVSFSSATGDIFSDVGPSVQFAGAIEKAYHDGIVSGYGETSASGKPAFGPWDNVNRAQLAKILSLAMQKYK